MQVSDEERALFGGQDEEDTDSLFGSPPPLPARGRSPSPALALPGGIDTATTTASNDASGLHSSTQNVGTIALPGSHHCSELPMIPLALPLNHTPQASTTSHPPTVSPYLLSSAQPTRTGTPTQPPTPSTSRASSAAPPRKKRPSKAKSRQPEAITGPQIMLPDPSEPLPPNFLRNQSALLGTAGVVAGVRPSHLPKRHERGTTPSNPIIVDDEDEQPLLGRGYRFRQPYAYDIDPKFLPAPTTQEIVAMLVGQRDIFPVLEGILRLVAGKGAHAAPPKRTGFERRAAPAQDSAQSSQSVSEAPPSKKRRLHNVPAGAADWDVPYPFKEGEGPEAYKQNWEQERGKQLLKQLMNLIKQATRKAATKSYFQREEAMRRMVSAAKAQPVVSRPDDQKVYGHYRPETVTYGTRSDSSTPAHSPSANANTISTPAPAVSESSDQSPIYPPTPASTPTPLISTPTPVFHPPQTPVSLSHLNPEVSSTQPTQLPTNVNPLDQLITSLLDAAPQTVSSSIATNPNLGAVAVNSLTFQESATSSALQPGTEGNSDHDPLQSATESSLSCIEGDKDGRADQNVFDDWMDIFQNFQMPQGTNLDSLPSDTTFAADFDALFGPESGAQNMSASGMDGVLDSINRGGIESWPFDDLATPFPSQSHHSAQHIPLDQTSQQSSSTTPAEHADDPTVVALSVPPEQSQGPQHVTQVRDAGGLAHFRSCLSASPMPSTSSSGDAYPLTPNSANWDLSVDVPPSADGGYSPSQSHEHQRFAIGGSEDEIIPSEQKEKGKGKEKQRECNAMLGSECTTARESLSPNLTGSILTPAPTGASRASSIQPIPPLSSSKAEIVKRARERRKQLTEELKNVRIQLWETTIEQGVLTHLVLPKPH